MSLYEIETEFFKTGVEPLVLPDGCTVAVVPYGKAYEYIFRDGSDIEINSITHNDGPLSLTSQTKIGKALVNHINPDDLLSTKGIQDAFEKVKVSLNQKLNLYIEEIDNYHREKRIEKEREEEEARAEALEVLNNIDNPLIYIASLISWETAGERKNITLTFLVFCSQVILNNPISVIGLGEGASGKTHLQEVAFKFLPPEYVLHEKNITEAALFNTSKKDPYHYDGKIVSFGDLGGKSSTDFVQQAKDLFKEMQSEGFLSKTVSVKELIDGEQEWVSEPIKLYGRPAIAYTTIPQAEFDDQELSRSIILTPRMDNDSIYKKREKALDIGGKSWERLKYHRTEIEQIKWMIRAIREKLEDVTVYNPYHSNVARFLGRTRYIKRDLPKYNSIVKVITAINGHNRQIYEINGRKYLLTTKNDMKLFMDLMEAYHTSISTNMTPKASDVLNEFRMLPHKEYEVGREPRIYVGLTANDYFDKSNLGLAKRSCQRYLYELSNLGLLKTEKKGRENIYIETSNKLSEMSNMYKLSEGMKDHIIKEVGTEMLDFIEEDKLNTEYSIEIQDEDIDKPIWD